MTRFLKDPAEVPAVPADADWWPRPHGGVPHYVIDAGPSRWIVNAETGEIVRYARCEKGGRVGEGWVHRPATVPVPQGA